LLIELLKVVVMIGASVSWLYFVIAGRMLYISVALSGFILVSRVVTFSMVVGASLNFGVGGSGDGRSDSGGFGECSDRGVDVGGDGSDDDVIGDSGGSVSVGGGGCWIVIAVRCPIVVKSFNLSAMSCGLVYVWFWYIIVVGVDDCFVLRGRRVLRMVYVCFGSFLAECNCVS
jgi:hypothetical protein